MRTKLYLASVAKLRDEALFCGLLPTVAAARREKIARCRDAGQKRLLLGAGLLLNRALAAEGLTAPDYAEAPEASEKRILRRLEELYPIPDRKKAEKLLK